MLHWHSPFRCVLFVRSDLRKICPTRAQTLTDTSTRALREWNTEYELQLDSNSAIHTRRTQGRATVSESFTKTALAECVLCRETCFLGRHTNTLTHEARTHTLARLRVQRRMRTEWFMAWRNCTRTAMNFTQRMNFDSTVVAFTLLPSVTHRGHWVIIKWMNRIEWNERLPLFQPSVVSANAIVFIYFFI